MIEIRLSRIDFRFVSRELPDLVFFKPNRSSLTAFNRDHWASSNNLQSTLMRFSTFLNILKIQSV